MPAYWIKFPYIGISWLKRCSVMGLLSVGGTICKNTMILKDVTRQITFNLFLNIFQGFSYMYKLGVPHHKNTVF